MTNIFGTEHDAKHINNDTFPRGEQYKFKFANGHSASVIRNEVSYGNQNGEGLWEVLLSQPIDGRTDPEGIVGWLTDEQVGELLTVAEALPKAGA